jgi:hypothetical protein
VLDDQRGPCSNILDLMANGAVVDNAVRVGAGAVLDGDGSSLTVPVSFETKGDLSAIFKFRLARGAGGYLASVASHGQQYLGLYVYKTRPAISFWYVPQGGKTSKSVVFRLPHAVNDGVWHRVMLTVDERTAHLHLDGSALGRMGLDARVSDCHKHHGADCETYVGRRAEPYKKNLFEFGPGEIAEARLYLNTVLAAHPAEPVPVTPSANYNMLLPSSFNADADTDALLSSIEGSSTKVWKGDGLRSLALESYPPHSSNGNGFSVMVDLRLTPGSKGYMFCKSTASGLTRYYCLYRSGNTFTLYYRGVNDIKNQEAKFEATTVDFSDKERHVLLFSYLATSGQARIHVDGRLEAVVDLGSDRLDDCIADTSNCAFHLGGRAARNPIGSSYAVAGIIYGAMFYLTPWSPEHAAAFSLLLKSDDLVVQQREELMARPGSCVRDDLDLVTSYADIESDFVSDEGVLAIGGETALPAIAPRIPSGDFSISLMLKIETGSEGFAFVAYSNETFRYPFGLAYFDQHVVLYTVSAMGTSQNELKIEAPNLDDDQFHSIQIDSRGSKVSVEVDTGSEHALKGVSENSTPPGLYCLREEVGCLVAFGEMPTPLGTVAGLNGSVVEATFFEDRGTKCGEYTGLGFGSNPYFKRSEYGYLQGRNEKKLEGVRPSVCALQCLEDELCKSFDAARADSSSRGTCYLSYHIALQADEGVMSSSKYDYFERVDFQ